MYVCVNLLKPHLDQEVIATSKPSCYLWYNIYMWLPIAASLIVASLSLTGVFVFKKHAHITGTHRFIIPVALGMFLGIVFFELIPETLEANETFGAFAIVGGFLSFYLLSHILKTYHHHHHDHCDDCVPKSSAHLLMIGDTIHNLADGVVITTAFLIDPTIGVATTIGVALHEIPQEIAQFGVLIHSGYTKTKAALYNVLSATSIILGVFLSYAFINAGNYLWVLTGIAAGNLLYIAASDMIPELHGAQHKSHFKFTFASTLAGLALAIALITYTHGSVEHEQHDSDLEGVKIAV